MSIVGITPGSGGSDATVSVVPIGSGEPSLEAANASKRSADQARVTAEIKDKLSALSDISLQISVDEPTGIIVIRALDTATGRVIREIPPEQVLKAVAQLLRYAAIAMGRTA